MNKYEVVLWQPSPTLMAKEEEIVLITTRKIEAEKKFKELENEYGYTRLIEIYCNGLFYRGNK